MKNIFFILILSLGLNACDMFISPKSYDFYCKIDGKKFVPERDTRPPFSGGAGPYRIQYNNVDGTLWISVKNGQQMMSLFIEFDNPEGEKGVFLIKEGSNDVKATYYPNGSKSGTNAVTGSIEILQIDDYDIVGKFDFVVKNKETSKDYKITKGHFNKPQI